ncbi:MAG: glycosyltransferase family 9 protein [Chlorobi bacterium]|nr:glycosyltransferase family 9 protein [Chlorobiota bacterium]MCI0716338.1 glycosyltransferase family 9 protein [Chlorobiota bacterium]
MKFDKTKVNKILVIKPGAIGDVLLSTPVIENLRHNFPYAQINYLTQSFCKDVLTDNPFLSRVLTYDLKKGDSSYCLLKNIHDQKYDLIIDLFSNPRTAIITLNSEAKYRVGYPFTWRRIAYNIKVKPRGGEVHNIEFNLDSLRALNLKIITNVPRFYLNNVHLEFAESFFAENGMASGNVIGINPCGSWPTKVWYLEKYMELAKKLCKDFRILLFWGNEQEKLDSMKIKDFLGYGAMLIPKVNLKYMGSLAKKCLVFISNDTGPMHIAWTLGVNTVAIFGPTNSHLQGPENQNSIIIKNESLPCLGCNLTRLQDCPNEHKCMRDLSVNEVYSKTMDFINSKSK